MEREGSCKSKYSDKMGKYREKTVRKLRASRMRKLREKVERETRKIE